MDERRVADPPGLSELAWAADRLHGKVDTQRAAFGGHACGLSSRLPRSAPDVEDLVVAFDTAGAAQHVVEQPQSAS